MTRTREIAIHVGAWLLYAANSVLTYPSEYLERYGVDSIAIKQGTFYAVMSVAFYVNYLVLVPRFLARKGYVGFGLGVVTLIPAMLGLFVLHALFLDWWFDAGTFFIDDRIPALPYLAFQVLFFLLISTGARFTADWFRMQRLRDELQHAKRNAELGLLRQQLSPHFLFNVLNNIYSLAVHRPQDVPRAILLLSDLMRAVLRTMREDHSTLQEEISQLFGYIELKGLQYPNGKRIHLDMTGTPDDRPLRPMLLLPFVENAFKHGDLHSDHTRVAIQLLIQPALVRLTVENTPSAGSRDATSGIGLKNVLRRLELLYPDDHDLKIEETADRYVVSLTLRIP